MPEADLALLLDAARDAAGIALRHFGRAPEVWEKPGGHGPVTEADLEVDRMLRASALAQALEAQGRPAVTDAVRTVLAALRRGLMAGEPVDTSEDAVAARVSAAVVSGPGVRSRGSPGVKVMMGPFKF